MLRHNHFAFGAASLTALGAIGILSGFFATKAANGRPRVPVIVELFTSEGCSSCPPADAVLTQLDKTQPVAGADIIVLGQHVDYWNNLGWSDPFSSHDFSVRQGEYATSFHTDQVYTPQMVIDGKTQLIGSDASGASAAIRDAVAQPKAQVSLKRIADQNPNRVSLEVMVTGWGAEKLRGNADVLLAVTEDNLQTQVGDGENEGRLLRHVGVVRQIRMIGTVSSKSAPISMKTEFALPAQWKSRDLHFVAFVQARNNRHILGAASVR